jgi:hypothetical protein
VLLNTIENSNCISDISPPNTSTGALSAGRGGRYLADADYVVWDG